jgi:hypothetical protein
VINLVPVFPDNCGAVTVKLEESAGLVEDALEEIDEVS